MFWAGDLRPRRVRLIDLPMQKGHCPPDSIIYYTVCSTAPAVTLDSLDMGSHVIIHGHLILVLSVTKRFLAGTCTQCFPVSSHVLVVKLPS